MFKCYVVIIIFVKILGCVLFIDIDIVNIRDYFIDYYIYIVFECLLVDKVIDVII